MHLLFKHPCFLSENYVEGKSFQNIVTRHTLEILAHLLDGHGT